MDYVKGFSFMLDDDNANMEALLYYLETKK